MQSCDKLLYIRANCSNSTTLLLGKLWQVVYELCGLGIKITFNFKLQLVFIKKRIGREATYKLMSRVFKLSPLEGLALHALGLRRQTETKAMDVDE